MATDISLIRQDLDKFRSRVSEVKSRVSTLKGLTRSDSREMRALQLQMRAIQECAIDTKNHLRHNNICVLSMPERDEGSKPMEFAERLLITLLGLDNVLPTFVKEWARRVPPIPSKLGAPPRHFLLRILKYRDQDHVLVAARAKPKIPFENTKLLFFPGLFQRGSTKQ